MQLLTTEAEKGKQLSFCELAMEVSNGTSQWKLYWNPTCIYTAGSHDRLYTNQLSRNLASSSRFGRLKRVSNFHFRSATMESLEFAIEVCHRSLQWKFAMEVHNGSSKVRNWSLQWKSTMEVSSTNAVSSLYRVLSAGHILLGLAT